MHVVCLASGRDDGAALRVPKVYAAEDVKSGRGSFIVMEWLDLGGRTDQAALGRAMGALHAAPCPDEWRDKPFGFACDNTIGATPQPNARSRDWVEFFRERRLAHQLALARSPKLSRLGERLLPRLDELFDDLARATVAKGHTAKRQHASASTLRLRKARRWYLARRQEDGTPRRRLAHTVRPTPKPTATRVHPIQHGVDIFGSSRPLRIIQQKRYILRHFGRTLATHRRAIPRVNTPPVALARQAPARSRDP